MKRLIAIVLALLMIIGTMPISVMAAEHSVILKVDTSQIGEVHPGESVKIPVVATTNAGISAFALQADLDEYGTSYLKNSITYKAGDITQSGFIEGDQAASWAHTSVGEVLTETGTLFYIDLAIPNDAPSGKTKIDLKIVDDDAESNYYYYVDYEAVPITKNFVFGEITIVNTPSDDGEDTPDVNDKLQVYYNITGIDDDDDNFVEIDPEGTFDVDVYVKSVGQETETMQAFDIYPTWAEELSVTEITAADGFEINSDEMGVNNPHFYSVAENLNKTVDGTGVKIATMTMELSDSAVYDTGYKVSLSEMTNMAVEEDAESVPVFVDTTEKGAETLKTYAVTYDANKGSNAPGSQEKLHNVNLTLSNEIPTRGGYTFANWNTKADGNGTDYAANATYAENAELELYAQWTANEVEVTLNAGEGKFADGEKELVVEETFGGTYEKVLKAEVPTREGYQFAGWKDVSGNAIGANTVIASAEAHTLTAEWTANTYKICFDLGDAANSGTVTAPEDINTSYDADKVSLPAPTGEYEGYKFAGWKLNDAIYNAGTQVNNLTTENNAIVTLTAQWDKADFNISVEENIVGGSVTALTENEKTAANMGDTINVTVKANEGYKFDKVFYYNTADKTLDDKIITEIPVDADGKGTFRMPASDVTVSAEFTAINYTVTVDPEITNGTVQANKTEGLHVGDIVTLTVTPKTGYKVKTVSFSEENQTKETIINAENGVYKFKMPAANVTVYAEFEGQEYAVTFDANGGGFAEGVQNTQTVIYGETYETAFNNVGEPKRDGYAFLGWFTEQENGEKIESTTIVSCAKDHTLYAHWEAKKYTITFVTNGGTFTDESGLTKNADGTFNMIYTYDDAFSEDDVKLPAIKKELQTLEGWIVSYEDNATEFGWGADESKINDRSSIVGMYGDVILTAQWKEDFQYKAEEYKYAYSDYVMLRIATTDKNTGYSFGENAMYYTDDENYMLEENAVFVTLISSENVELVDGKFVLTADAMDMISMTTYESEDVVPVIERDGLVNKNDEVVNIADANAVYQMVEQGGDYYSMDQLGILNRLKADMDTADVTGEHTAEHRGSIADVHAIVKIINENANK